MFEKEADLCMIMTAINIKVALDYFGIGIVSVLSFSCVWYDNFEVLLQYEPRISALPHFHMLVHLGWLGKLAGRAGYNSSTTNSVEYTKAYRELSVHLSNSGVLALEPGVIYASF